MYFTHFAFKSERRPLVISFHCILSLQSADQLSGKLPVAAHLFSAVCDVKRNVMYKRQRARSRPSCVKSKKPSQPNPSYAIVQDHLQSLNVVKEIEPRLT